jgi:hypothetical protein
MPALTRWFIKTALLWLVTALALGVAMQQRALVAVVPELASAWPAYLHLLTVGWLTGLIAGVSWWLFPRPARAGVMLPGWTGWLAYASLNVGLLLRLVAEPATALAPGSALRWLLPVAALLQLTGACAFAAAIWPRVRVR